MAHSSLEGGVLHRRAPGVAGLALLLAALLLAPAPARAAPSRRALVVGIDAYGAGGIRTGGRVFRPLRGAVADANAFADVLRARGFEVALLVDGGATREAILAGLADLGRDAAPGDVRVFYYAGHGSRVRNSLSPELDRLDESIVPADVGEVRAGAEVRDLRDKELAPRLSAILEKDAILTVVLDSCNSGSATRGPPQALAGEPRRAPWDERDVRDATRLDPPERRGALILSAAQDEQAAQELGAPVRGAFTRALVEAMTREGAADLPARAVFLAAADAVHVATGGTQDPVLAGPVQRQRATLLDARPVAATDERVVRVRHLGTALVAENPPFARLGAGTVLERQAGARKLRLVVASGEAAAPGVVPVAPHGPGPVPEVEEGAPFRIAEWVVAGEGMKVWIPPGLSAAQVGAARAAVARLRETGVALVDDPVDGKPTHRLEALAAGEGVEWLLTGPCARLDAGARGPDPVSLVRAVLPREGGAPACEGGTASPRLFVGVPPTRELADGLRAAWAREGGLVSLAGAFNDAVYVLDGRLEPGGLAHAWVRAGAAPAAMPARTDFVSVPAQAGLDLPRARLADLAQRLGKSFGWLGMTGSDPVAQAAFGWELALSRPGTEVRVGDGGVTRRGESYGLVLRRRPGPKANAGTRRWVYVFVMDAQGRRQLLFPRKKEGHGDVENHLPLEGFKKKELVLDRHAFDVSPPFGTDTFFLYAATAKLRDPFELEDDAVRSTRSAGGVADPEDVLRGVSPAGEPPASVPRWTLTRLAVTSVER